VPEETLRASFARVCLYDDEEALSATSWSNLKKTSWRVHDGRLGFARDLDVDAGYGICPSFETMSGALEDWLWSFGYFAQT
jgi:hypothetical protein